MYTVHHCIQYLEENKMWGKRDKTMVKNWQSLRIERKNNIANTIYTNNGNKNNKKSISEEEPIYNEKISFMRTLNASTPFLIFSTCTRTTFFGVFFSSYAAKRHLNCCGARNGTMTIAKAISMEQKKCFPICHCYGAFKTECE